MPATVCVWVGGGWGMVGGGGAEPYGPKTSLGRKSTHEREDALEKVHRVLGRHHWVELTTIVTFSSASLGS